MSDNINKSDEPAHAEENFSFTREGNNVRVHYTAIRAIPGGDMSIVEVVTNDVPSMLVRMSQIIDETIAITEAPGSFVMSHDAVVESGGTI